MEIFNDDEILKKIIFNRLGGDWLLPDDKGTGVNESFNFTAKQIIQGMRSTRSVQAISMFKPYIAKYMATKYSSVGDLIYDYSAGFGGRLLGTMSCNRRYVGVDPQTALELNDMAKFFDFKDYNIKAVGSEEYCPEENSVDFSWSSPPYYNQEVYSLDKSQAYNNGEDYFYNEYWKKTLENIKFMLKPDKWLGLNVKNYPKMLEMAQDYFGDIIETVQLKTVRSHLNKSAGVIKYEGIFMFRNIK